MENKIKNEQNSALNLKDFLKLYVEKIFKNSTSYLKFEIEGAVSSAIIIFEPGFDTRIISFIARALSVKKLIPPT